MQYKNREDLLVELHEQGRLKKCISSTTQTRIGCLIEAANDRMDNDTEQDEDS